MVFKSLLPDVVPDERHKDLVSNFFWHQLDQFAAKTLLVDYVSKREWTGESIKKTASLVAANLIELGQLKTGDVCVTFYKNCDYIHLTALGVLFAGGTVCAGAPEDPELEHAYMVTLMRPAFVVVTSELVDEMAHIRQQALAAKQLSRPYRIIVMDDSELSDEQFAQLSERASHQDQDQDQDQDQEHAHEPRGPSLIGFRRHLLSRAAPAAPSQQLPVQVDPEQAAFVLLTSGSTGKPKPVGRSQRNSLYMSHGLNGAEHLWDLNESSVLAGHLQLDHGTGIFCLKITLSKGCKLVAMHGYEYATMLDAIKSHAITDVVLGSALLHNLMVAALAAPDTETDTDNSNSNPTACLKSVLNFIAAGSPIASRPVVDKYMAKFSQCSVRQAYGMTECGWLTIVERNLAQQDTDSVGCLLPNVAVKLVDRATGQEVGQFDTEGELFISGPTVSRGYLGAEFSEQSAAVFLADGYYKSNDICSVTAERRLRIRGRFSEVLCLHDGWKVLPSEIEEVILMHPLVKEAAVIGIPHPQLSTCHAPRAYIVPKDGVGADFEAGARPNGDGTLDRLVENGVGNGKDARDEQPRARLTSESVYEFVAERLSEPKHLVGGIKIMRELPRISIGKVDKKLLRKMDGY